MIASRRSFIGGLVALVAAPSIVRAESLMPVKLITPVQTIDFIPSCFVDCVHLNDDAYRMLAEHIVRFMENPTPIWVPKVPSGFIYFPTTMWSDQ